MLISRLIGLKMTVVLRYVSPVFLHVSLKCRILRNKPQTREFREIIKRPPYRSTTAPFPHRSLFTGKRGIAFLQTPPIRYPHTSWDRAEPLSQILQEWRQEGRGGGLEHTALVVSLTTQAPDKTTTDRLCRLNKGVCACQQGKRLDTVIVVLF